MEDVPLKRKNEPLNPTGHKLNYKILGLIVGLIILYQYGLMVSDNERFNATDIAYFVGIIGCALFATFVAGRYYGSEMFGRAYGFLGAAFVCQFMGDAAYYYFDYFLEIDPWPTPFDAFYLGVYVFAILHLFLNIRYFKPKWDKRLKGILVGIPIVVVSVFSLLAYTEWGIYDELFVELFYVDLFVLGGSITVALAIIGVIVFKNSVLKETWLLLAIGIFFYQLADVWYYYMEIFEAYDNSHPINTVWVASFMIIIYALYKHHKAL